MASKSKKPTESKKDKQSEGSHDFSDNEVLELHAPKKPKKPAAKKADASDGKKKVKKPAKKEDKVDEALKKLTEDEASKKPVAPPAGKASSSSKEAAGIAQTYKNQLQQDYGEGQSSNDYRPQSPAQQQQIQNQAVNPYITPPNSQRQYAAPQQAPAARPVAYSIPQAQVAQPVQQQAVTAQQAVQQQMQQQIPQQQARPAMQNPAATPNMGGDGPGVNFGRLSLFLSPLILPGLGLGLYALGQGIRDENKKKQGAQGVLAMFLSTLFLLGLISLFSGAGPTAYDYASQPSTNGAAFNLTLPEAFEVSSEGTSGTIFREAREDGLFSTFVSVNMQPLGSEITESQRSLNYAALQTESLFRIKDSFEERFDLQNMQFGSRRPQKTALVPDGIAFDILANSGNEELQGLFIQHIGERTNYDFWIIVNKGEWSSKNAEWVDMLNSWAVDTNSSSTSDAALESI